ncbi:type II toxin-antitoxin system HicA family toxin [Ruminococcus sp.]|uniref:type II toxin-antitoxin system HicA family toxin n=1 Tax=Ruminococcus sp. TaxID=41978 RepID=UPI0025D8E1D1|nr:type II toxin-antitoxin system HicA family toxin [Ruminococcus sp.]
MKFREVEKLLLQDGWLKNVKGSHYQYKHPSKVGKVTIPNHGGDLDLKTVKSILTQAGLNNNDK